MKWENIYGKIQSADKAMEHMHDGMVMMCGGFGGVGSPPLLCKSVADYHFTDITLICNDAGFPHLGIGPVVCNGQVKKMITTHIGSNPVAGRLINEGKMEAEFIPQGTFCERIRAGGVGLGGILCDIGIDTVIANGKDKITLNSREYLIEPAITAEVGIFYAKKADPFGNLIYDKTARNTNPLMVMACDFSIVQAEEIVPLGGLNPEEIITPGVYVDMVVAGQGGEWKWNWQLKN